MNVLCSRYWRVRSRLAKSLVITSLCGCVLLSMHFMILLNPSLDRQSEASQVFVKTKDDAPLFLEETAKAFVRGEFYLINFENVCRYEGHWIIMPVHSAVNNFERRLKMREGQQGKFASDKNNHARLLFFVGLPSSTSFDDVTVIRRKLEKEAEEYGDIIQINEVDTYHNVVKKAIAVLKWINTYCKNSEFVIKMDDDIRVDMKRAVNALIERKKTYPHFILGDKRTGRVPHRFTSSKYFISEEEYPEPT